MSSDTKEGYLYRDHPQTCAPDDFWGQVKRTVNGKPVSQEQIDMIVAAAKQGLQLQSDDLLLDICCGNGALTTYLFAGCRGGTGVDFSEFLIDVAQKHFVQRESESFVMGDVIEFARKEDKPARVSKAMCYGSFQYLPHAAAAELLQRLHARFPGLKRIFIGNVPDRDRLHDYYREKDYVPGIENSPSTPIGIWRSEGEFEALAAAAGWKCAFSRMPPAYYGAHYRFDAVLTRDGA